MSACDLPGPEGFLGQVGKHIADDMPKRWVHRLLVEGRAPVLVDGVDELPEPGLGDRPVDLSIVRRLLTLRRLTVYGQRSVHPSPRYAG